MEYSALDESKPPEPPSSPPRSSTRALAIGGAALALGLFVTVGAFVQLINPAFGIWFTEVFLFLGLGWVLLRSAGWKPAIHTGLVPMPQAPTLFGFLLGLANFFACVVPLQYASQAVAPEWLKELYDASKLFEGQTPLELGLILAGVTVAAPVCEEFFFRGIFQRGITPSAGSGRSPMRGLVIAAVIFSAFHLDPVGFLARAELGFLFGWLYLRTGSLWPGIGAHAANNLVSSVLFIAAKALTKDGVEETDTNPLAVLAMAAVGIAVLAGLISAARRLPAVWGQGTYAAEEESRAPLPVPSLAKVLLPWVAAATLSLGALAAVDGRGIALSLFDISHPLPTLGKKAPAALQAERGALRTLRASARRGQVPMEVYEEERIRQSSAHARRPLPSEEE